MSQQGAGQKCVTPEAIISFPALFRATKGVDPTKPKKYGCTLVFPKGTDLTALKQAVITAAEAKFGDKAAEVIRDQKDPVFRGSQPKYIEQAKKYGYPEGCTFISVTSKDKPGVVSTFRGEDGRPQEITDEKAIYSGAIVRASVYAHAYDSAGNKGVTFFLNNVQKIRDGQRMDGKIDARDEFEATDAPVDLSELDAVVTAPAASDNLADLLG
jgi:hypothetical protein